MDIILAVLLVFGTSILELWAGIPLGLALNLNPFLIGIVSALGAISAALIVSFIGDNIRERFMKWRYGEKDLKMSRFYKIWNNYGIIGLGLLSPLIFGAGGNYVSPVPKTNFSRTPLGAALGIALGAEKRPLLIWMSIGIVLWSALLTAGGYFGLMSFEAVH